MKEFLAKELDVLRQRNLYRTLRTVENDQGPEIVFNGKKVLNFSSNNYLGLACDPRLKKAAIAAINEYGTGSGASRLITGSMILHEQLEKAIASFKGTERALLFNSGYHANIGAIPSLAGEGDLIFSDELNHASLIDGCRLSKVKTVVYRHGDVGHLEELLSSTGIPPPLMGGGEGAGDPVATLSLTLPHRGGGKQLIITDTLFSMDGDLCNLPEIMKLAEKYDAWVYVDEAHATGVFGKTGRGVVEHSGIDPHHPRLIQMGTLGKALGSFGAYVCGSNELIEWLINRARSFIYTTALPPAVLGASLAAIKIVQEDDSLRKRLWENVEYFGKGLKNICSVILSGAKNLPRLSGGSFADAQDDIQLSPIFPLIIGDAQKTMKISEKLFEQGIWANGIRPPSVPPGASKIRLTLMATHTKDHLNRCLDAITECENIKTAR